MYDFTNTAPAVVAGDANSGGSVREVVHAVSSFSGGAGGVRVVGLHGVAEQLDVSITKLRDGAIATSGASTGKRVRGTRSHLLCGKLRQVSCGDRGVRFDHLGRAESPAAAALSLVLDLRDGALVPPVNGVGQLTAGLGLESGRGWHSDSALGHPLVTTGHLGLKLSLGEVGELIHSHLPSSESIVPLNLGQVSVEDVLPQLKLSLC